MTTGTLVGYARTSTVDQEAGLHAQVAELQAAGATKVFQEHVSSVDAQRPQLRAALDWCRDGDTFIVTKPDRLARSVTDLLRIVEDLKARNVTLRIMSMGVDTSTATGVLILQVLGAVSQWERSVMLERQAHGIAKAKAEGKYRGRAPTARAKAPEVLQMKASGRSINEIMESLQISRASVYRAFAEAKDTEGA
ncbi:MAG: recombinase family protein [Alphaproteobacteria bacterium]|nr:MAG: recombinase family protein [Alphaproteobacteria bacterium]